MTRLSLNISSEWMKSEPKAYVSRNIPNEETIRTIEESKIGIDINFCESKQDFLNYLSNLRKKVDKELAEKK